MADDKRRNLRKLRFDPKDAQSKIEQQDPNCALDLNDTFDAQLAYDKIEAVPAIRDMRLILNEEPIDTTPKTDSTSGSRA
jgi:hypothetical protein